MNAAAAAFSETGSVVSVRGGFIPLSIRCSSDAETHPGNEPIIVSLTIDAGDIGPIRDTMDKELRSFTAVRGYESKGLSLYGAVQA